MRRRFVHVKGFGDDTMWIEVDTETGKSYLVNWNWDYRETLNYPLDFCLRAVEEGSWREMQPMGIQKEHTA